ncbi:MAG: hypothetical protein K8U03_00350, partial [Planctomycetia bacterium]|nr:hypothetical protein [Planctomycetia bacterium]
GAASIARCDALDVALMSNIEKVRDYLIEHRYTAVGVLDFRLQRGQARPTFDGGLIVSSLSERLETALIACLQDKQRLTIVRDPSKTAGGKLGAANYRTEDDRRRLFELDYKQAWGNPAPDIRVDAFLAGKVVISDDLRKLKVIVEAFDRSDPGVVADVVTFEAPVDRHILAAVGQGFSLSTENPQAMLRAVTEDDVFNAIQKSKSKPTPVVAASSTTEVARPIHVTAYYDGVPQTMTLDADRPGNANYVLPTPRAGQELTIGVGNHTKEDLGLVVSVNGVSTLYEQKGSPDVLKKWILEPEVEYLIKGLYEKGGTTYKTIRALSERQSRERFADLGGEEHAGLIMVYVFRRLPKVEITSITTTPSIRVLSDSELAEHKPGTLDELQSLIVPGKFNRGLFSWGDRRAEALQESSLGPAQLTDTLVIRYYHKPPAK